MKLIFPPWLAVLALSLSMMGIDSRGDAVTELQAQIDALRQSTKTAQTQISVGMRLGTISSAQLVTMAGQVQQLQAQRVALEQQLAALNTQTNTAGGGTGFGMASRGGSTTFGSGLGTGNAAATPPPLSGPSVAGLSTAQLAVANARQNLSAQVQALQAQSPGDGQALVNLLTQWQSDNSALLAQARQDAATASAAQRPQALARLLAQQQQGAQPAAPANLPPKMQALVQERQQAVRDLQIVILQNSGPADYQAALTQWQAKYGQALSRMSSEATSETQAIGVAAATRMLNGAGSLSNP